MPCNPVSSAYALVTLYTEHLFIDSRKLSDETKDHLSAANIQIHEYSEMNKYACLIQLTCLGSKQKVLVDFNQVNYNLYKQLTTRRNDFQDVVVVNKPSLISLPKATKNEVEINGMYVDGIIDSCCLHYAILH